MYQFGSGVVASLDDLDFGAPNFTDLPYLACFVLERIRPSEGAGCYQDAKCVECPDHTTLCGLASGNCVIGLDINGLVQTRQGKEPVSAI